MKIPWAEARQLLRAGRSAALATHSLAAPGYPGVSLLPYGLDAACRPIFLLSALAEHTRNVLADARASLLVAEGGEGAPLAQARLTLFGRVVPVALDDAATARQLRYQPEWRDYLALGDFRFFRLNPERARLIAGFGRMGWLEAEAPAFEFAPQDEEALVARLALLAPPASTVLGLDAEGLDVRLCGVLRRFPLAPSALDGEAVWEAAAACLRTLADGPPEAGGPRLA